LFAGFDLSFSKILFDWALEAMFCVAPWGTYDEDQALRHTIQRGVMFGVVKAKGERGAWDIGIWTLLGVQVWGVVVAVAVAVAVVVKLTSPKFNMTTFATNLGTCP
jgi:hypothetical protein